MNNVNNLDALAEKIFEEGIEKAKKQSEEILAEAHERANKIIREAEVRAEEYLNKAKQDAEKLKINTVNEIQLKSNQALSDLKSKIENLIKIEVLNTALENAFNEKEFISKLILKATDKWTSSEELELWLSSDMKEKVESYLFDKLKKKLPGLTIKVNESMKGGFKVKIVDEGYYISFSEGDFNEFFNPYFSEQIQRILFKSNSQ